MRAFLAHLLAGAAGGTEARWRQLIGTVEQMPIWQFVAYNWRVSPKGTAKQREAIERAVEVVRAEHPYIHNAERLRIGG